MKYVKWKPKGMKIRIHPLFVLLLIAAVLTGMWADLLLLFSIIIVHELGHVFVANAYGYKIKEMEILPFGGVAKLEHGRMGWNPRHEASIAVAGPLFNFLMIGFAILLLHAGVFSENFTSSIVKGNLVLAFFNMLPAFPLDGGRILRAALSRNLGFRMASEVALRMAFVISLFLMILGVASLWIGQVNVGLITLGVFLFFSAWQLKRQLRYDTVRFLDTKRRSMIRNPLPVRSLVVNPDMSVRQVLDEFTPDAYHMLYVVDGEKRVIDVIAEEELLNDFMVGGGVMSTIRDHLSYRVK
ncbi:stage IV sporulation protein FB [Collibacillus ludicampi]|jgi:stage IV sporulation protein FB|uniref:Stage IV sporulation protein FB n=1 Tax=Collibacillus ludicampi TaxID=2771369 RepID=A0AAV4L9Z4_9BACL|nr:site-2 protease family protein [Collibacillus ludicampi]GIM44597.1 stage IV sporulation protein FB [Collibacillus ludicampi]